MGKRLLLLIPAITLSLSTLFAQSTKADEESFIYETWNNQKVEAFRGSLKVPENRSADNSRMISIQYVRLPAMRENHGSPIIYLSGGPGGSGIMAINYRYDMFMALRQYGDVIALDQRGTGASNIVPECRSKHSVPANKQISDLEFITLHQHALRECLAFWKNGGTDIGGYNTLENARDLEALRQHLGAEKIILWGTSYGSHLALTALKTMGEKIEKIVMSSVEGLNQTIKLPARTNAYLDRLQAAVNSQPKAKVAYPDIKSLMQRVHAKLDQHPLPLQLALPGGEKVDFLLQRRDMQLLAASLISDPQHAARLLQVYRTIDRGTKPSFENIPGRLLPDRFVAPGQPITMQAMPYAMDIASGMTEQRKANVKEQAKTAILNGYLNFTFYYDEIAPQLDLGDHFRTNPISEVPVLLLSGTLDGRTYIESQREAVAGLKNVTRIKVRNAGHNLFDVPSDEIQNAINRFLEDKPALQTIITVDLPNMDL